MVENLQGGGSVCSRGFFGWKGKPGTKKKEADDDAIIVYIVFYVVLLGSIPLLGMLHFCPPFFVACVGVRFIPSLSLSIATSLYAYNVVPLVCLPNFLLVDLKVLVHFFCGLSGWSFGQSVVPSSLSDSLARIISSKIIHFTLCLVSLSLSIPICYGHHFHHRIQYYYYHLILILRMNYHSWMFVNLI